MEHFTLIDPHGDADVYARLSKQKDDKVATCDVQIANVTRDLKRLGLKVRATWVDDGISAWSGKERPGYLGMLAAIKRGDVRIVAAVDMDRFSRQNGEVDALLMLAIRSECRIIFGGTEIDLDSPMAVGMAKIAGVLAEMESSVKGERIRRAHAVIAEQGRFHGGSRSFGYLADGVTPHPDEAPLYRELIERVARGESPRTVAEDWRTRGILAPKGKPFDAAKLRFLVLSPRHAGFRVRDGKVIGNAIWEGLVTPAEQARAVAAIKARFVSRSPRVETNRAALLQGFVHCGVCGHKLRISRKTKGGQPIEMYRCPSMGGGSCGGVSVTMSYADKEVEQRFFARLTDPKVQRKLAKQQAAAPDVSAILARIDEIDADLGMLQDMLKAGGVDRDYFRTSVKTLTESKAQAQRDLESSSLPLAITTDPETLLAKWGDLLDEEKRANLVAVIERVEVDVCIGPNRKLWNPDRVRITWKDAASA